MQIALYCYWWPCSFRWMLCVEKCIRACAVITSFEALMLTTASCFILVLLNLSSCSPLSAGMGHLTSKTEQIAGYSQSVHQNWRHDLEWLHSSVQGEDFEEGPVSPSSCLRLAANAICQHAGPKNTFVLAAIGLLSNSMWFFCCIYRPFIIACLMVA